jgi:hypothetical protein
MKRRRHLILMWLLVWCTAYGALAQKRSSLMISDDKLLLTLDLRSSSQVLDSILKVAGVSGASGSLILKNNLSALQKDGWRLQKKQDGLIELIKPLADLAGNPQSKPFAISVDLLRNGASPGYPDEVYGVNSFSRVTVFELPSGMTRFFLPGYLSAKKVLLSGNFNLWSTNKGIMVKTDSGWVRDIRMEPGAYAYKFIINGRWLRDGNNRLKQDDGVGSFNSLYFRYNYTFKLPAHLSAARVSVAGSFNNWNANEIVMMRAGNAWQRRMYLREGSYDYRFMVDGKWSTDPGNPVIRKDASGNSNSVLRLGEQVNFKLSGYQNARKVCVAGNFNDWKPDMLYLQKSANGWFLPFVLSAGNYQYKFIVDNEWMPDPANPHRANGDGESNSLVALKPNYTFRLKGYGNAKTIRISGDFNDWDPTGYTMAHKGNEWLISLRLKPGKHLYKYIVDGDWIIDPGNKLWEQNEFNTGNSVLWIER